MSAFVRLVRALDKLVASSTAEQRSPVSACIGREAAELLAAVHVVYFQRVDRCHHLEVAKLELVLSAPGRDRLAVIHRENRERILHHGACVVRRFDVHELIVDSVDLCKLSFHSRENIFLDDSDVLISVRPHMLVEKTESVHKLMLDGSLVHASFEFWIETCAAIWRF